MLRRLSLPEHSAVELLAGLALIAAPFALGFGPGGLIGCMAAGVLLVGLGVGEGLAIATHMTADTLLAGGLIGAGLVLAASGERMAGGLLAAVAAGELALGLGTRWTRPRGRLRRASR
jgi:hypothetical protein